MRVKSLTSTTPSEPSVPRFADVSVISPDVFQFRKLRLSWVRQQHRAGAIIYTRGVMKVQFACDRAARDYRILAGIKSIQRAP
jgi:hypothetical protein